MFAVRLNAVRVSSCIPPKCRPLKRLCSDILDAAWRYFRINYWSNVIYSVANQLVSGWKWHHPPPPKSHTGRHNAVVELNSIWITMAVLVVTQNVHTVLWRQQTTRVLLRLYLQRKINNRNKYGRKKKEFTFKRIIFSCPQTHVRVTYYVRDTDAIINSVWQSSSPTATLAL